MRCLQLLLLKSQGYITQASSGSVLAVCKCQMRSRQSAVGPVGKGWILVLPALGRITV